MSDITRDDLRAAVGAGMMTEAQAASLITLAEEREGVRARRSGLDEPFELFKGFNEIFIVVGLTILFAGWSGVTGLSLISTGNGYVMSMVFSFIAMGVLIPLARYFTIARRMVAPSIALAIMFGLSSVQFGLSFAAMMDATFQGSWTVAAGFSGVMLSLYYYIFRVPFTVALIAVSVVVMTFGFVTMGGTVPDRVADIFLLSADGPFAFITIVLGFIGLGIALAFDMSDPHRVTRRAASGFWLHVIAAPAIVNTVALTLFQNPDTSAKLLLLAFIMLMALFAVIIDRRSFLVSGVGYVVALSISVVEGEGAFLVILLLGAGMVLLGAQWERMRGAIMGALPDFPGKDRLPPYAMKEPA
ncbi:hypothetical protein [Gymnodinialimonas ceratoperidinii]|uniref:DUF2157 domain-containing protein n=1 Tax=Gymnodinialimonas ceratoperidinii TaxID=2856823 RepID=A0A8F6TX05_9RHOB|nr:hypothetical protein [Gymnodinialimonas ceratoperidinii]QXT39988.1 hypothetical protein KYE46_01625 [Gymnodinialimonas ceratoperidinii]